MIECPWCHEHVQLVDDICPVCKQEVLQSHLNARLDESDVEELDENEEVEITDLSSEEHVLHDKKAGSLGTILDV